MNSKLLRQFAQPDERGLQLLKTAMHRLNLSARAYDRILKVARTIADLEGRFSRTTWQKPSATATSTARTGQGKVEYHKYVSDRTLLY